MKLVIEITTDNAAFDPDPAPELARILRDLAESFASGDRWNPLWVERVQDINGNDIGLTKWAEA